MSELIDNQTNNLYWLGFEDLNWQQFEDGKTIIRELIKETGIDRLKN